MRVVLNFGIELRMDDFEIGTCYHITLSNLEVSVQHLFCHQETPHLTHKVYLCVPYNSDGKGENTVQWIKGRISWLGHVQRMEEDRMPRKIFTQELEGTRRKGRPRKRCKDEVERDLQVLGVRRWRELVADRKKWKDNSRQAKAHSGL